MIYDSSFQHETSIKVTILYLIDITTEVIIFQKEHTLKQKYSQFKNYYEQNYTDLLVNHFVSGGIELSYIAYCKTSPLNGARNY